MARPLPELPWEPSVVRDSYSPLGSRWVLVGRTFCGWRAVGLNPAFMPGLNMRVTERVLQDWHRSHYADVDLQNSSCQSVIDGLKKEALAHGATALAVQWLGELSPFTEEELKIMATKLKTKGGDTAAAKPAKADKAAPKSKGNPEALEKARAARAERATENRKYKALVKLKDVKLREGTWTAAMVEIILSNTTTDAAKEALANHAEFSDKRLDFAWAEKKEYIAFA